MAIVATVLAFGFAFGFAACGNSGEGGDDSVLTEEQWTKAFEDTLASKTLTMEQYAKSTYTNPKQDGTGFTTEARETKQCLKYDLNNYLMYAMIDRITVAEGDQKIYNEEYDEVSETKIIIYQNNSSQSYNWTARTQRAATVEAAIAEFEKK